MVLPSPADLVRDLLQQDPERPGLDLRQLSGLGGADVEAIARLGAAALAGNRPADAATIFGALEALDPSNAQHSFHRAYAEAAAGQRARAIAACDRFLEVGEDAASPADTVRALLLRAGQRDSADARLIASDLAAARFIASRDDEARLVLEGREPAR
jgi:tetratricopeptide (TPR) repeat protein